MAGPSTKTVAAESGALDVGRVRADFPILRTLSHGRPLVYLDNGATTQKPQQVIDAVSRFYEQDNANIHRGVYELSQRATEAYEQAREKVRRFIHAREAAEVVFTRGTTEGINLVASGFARGFLRPGQQVVVSEMEHHSNIVPWQMACEMSGASLRVIPMNERGELELEELEKLLKAPTAVVAVNHISNSLGTVNPVERIIQMAHAAGAKALVDGAQWVAHHGLDVQALDADFYAFSGHKLYGPTGIGILWGKRRMLEALPPYQGGGDMIASVTFAKTLYAELPNKFEAGTSDIAGAVGLGAAVDYVAGAGLERIAAHEAALLARATEALAAIRGVRIIGTAKEKGGVVSFVVDDPPMASLDLGLQLDLRGIAVRTGHHCCQPAMARFGVASTTRASFAMYNTFDEVDALARALEEIIEAERRKAKPSTSTGSNSGGNASANAAPAQAAVGHQAARAQASVATAGAKHTATKAPMPAGMASPAQHVGLLGGGSGGGSGGARPAGAVNSALPDELAFPPASTKSPQESADELAEMFELLGERDARSQYVLEMGEKLPAMPTELKNESTRVHGCMSVVHLAGRRRPGTQETVEFLADSDAHIVRGLIAVLQRLFSGHAASQVLAFDVNGFFTRIGLEQFISSQRRNGLAGMVKRIRELATGVAAMK